MSMMGVKGMNFSNAVWDLAVESNPCGCDDEYAISQDVLGEVKCEKCNKILLTQLEVDSLERHGCLPEANVSIDYIQSFRNQVNEVKNETKQERLETINKLVVKISSLGRRFFYYDKEERVARFVLNNNRLYWIDEYTQSAIYAYGHKYFKRSFSNGGTLQSLVLDFSHFIRTGEQVNGKNGYGGLHAYAWGYPLEDQKEIIAYAKEIGYLSESSSDEPYRIG